MEQNAAAAGDPNKTVYAPYDCTVVSTLAWTEAKQVLPGQPLLVLHAGGGEETLKALTAGLIVYMPAKPGLVFKKGEPLLFLL